MLALRAYLLVRRETGEWFVTTHRDLDSIYVTWRASATDLGSTGVLHVGFDRPDTPEFEEVARGYPGRVLLTAPAWFALPRPPKVAPIPAGAVRNIPVFVALAGWGYTCTAEEVGLEQEGDDAWEQGRAPVSAPTGWVAKLHSDEPSLAAAVVQVGISDEATYGLNEHKLGGEQRIRLAEFRLYNLAGTERPNDPITVARHAPPWLLSRSVESLNLTVRITNVFAEMKIAAVRDLLLYPEGELLTLRKFGRKSLMDLTDALMAALREGPGGKTSGKDVSLLSSIRLEIAGLPERAGYILRRRMSLEAPGGTLQEIGDELGVTRERIRQVESKYLKKIAQECTWPRTLREKLDRLLMDRGEPLPVQGLDILDPWFEEIDEWPDTVAYLLEIFGDQRFSLLQINNQTVVSALSRVGWESAITDAYRMLDSGVDEGWTEDQARSAVATVLTGPGRELSRELWHVVAPSVHFAMLEDGGRILTGVGRGVEPVVEAILLESDRPLHFSEIAQRATARAGRSVDIRRAHNAAASIGLLYGRGTYGLVKHFPLKEEEADVLISEAENLMENGPPDRQWHCFELCGLLIEEGLDFGGRLSPYVVNIALGRSSACAYLGRLVWTLRQGRSLSTADRIGVRQAIIAILGQEGRPMTTTELRRRLAGDRGLPENFQIYPSGPLVRLPEGLWGLIDRDITLSPAEQKALVDELVTVLARLGHGLHGSEVLQALCSIPAITEKISDPKLLCALAKRSERVRISSGQYVYLPEWDGPRRLTVEEGIEQVFLNAPPEGVTLDQLEDEIIKAVGRPISRAGVSSALQAFGARWHSDTGQWFAPDSVEDPDIARSVDP
jgi:Bacterial RNA polymerase, alpha chain C terminal domain/Sigma-70, region 4